MLVSDRLIFIQLEKTGCSHIARLLEHIVGGKQEQKHSRIPDSIPTEGKSIVGSIRNPWDWYVSMWSYGCIQAGALYDDLMTRPKLLGQGWRRNPWLATRNTFRDFRRAARGWRDTYGDATDPSLFRRWLHLIHEPANRFDLMDDYARSPVSLYSGFYTYRYARMFTRDLDKLYSNAMCNPENLKSLLFENTLLDYVIRNERLESDLIDVLQRCDIPLSTDAIAFLHNTYKTNPTERVRRTAYYYDPDTIELVRSRDMFLIEKYGYEPPILD